MDTFEVNELITYLNIPQLYPVYLVYMGVAACLRALLYKYETTGSAWWFYAYAIPAWPGTVGHELAHYLVGVVTKQHPSSFSVIPNHKTGGMGSVKISPSKLGVGIGSMLTAMAPWVLLPLSVVMVRDVGYSLSPNWEGATQWDFIKVWLASSMFLQGVPSGADFKIAAPGVVVIVITWWLLNFAF